MQPLVFAQGVLDLAVARKRGVVVDAQTLCGLQLGLVEIADAREAQRSYEANLKMFDQIRQMSSSLLDLLRK